MQSTESKQVRLARAIATAAHHGQFRRDGKTPYLTHVEAVAAAVSARAKPAALLHDVTEARPDFDSQFFRLNGISGTTVLAVMYLMHNKKEPYMDYIQRIRLNRTATKVKIADIKHNLSCQPTRKKAAMYRAALEILELPL